jgi:hypothetical protein
MAMAAWTVPIFRSSSVPGAVARVIVRPTSTVTATSTARI